MTSVLINKIHILGASGSGTTTLASELSKRINYTHFDTDDYYWLKTDPPFQNKRCIEDRQALMKTDSEIHLIRLTGCVSALLI